MKQPSSFSPVWFEPKKAKPEPVSLVPLINIVFLLLIFFLVAGTYTEPDRVPIEVPKAQTSNVLESRAEAISRAVLLVPRPSELWLNDQRIEEKDLQAELTRYAKHTKDPEMLIKANADLPATYLLQIMQVVHRSGISNLSVGANTTPHSKGAP